MTSKNFLIAYVEKFNSGDIGSLISIYELDACFVSQEGKAVKGLENIRQILQGLIGMNGKLESKVIGVIRSGDIALVNSE